LVQFISVGVRYSAIIIVLPWFQVGEGTGIPMPSSIGDDGEQVPYPRANFFLIILANVFIPVLPLMRLHCNISS
jgi:hypothetical protein